jgi:hypothetical protein
MAALSWNQRDGFLKRVLGSGQILYRREGPYENAGTAMVLRVEYPDQAAELNFKNPVLAAFSNAVWHCSTAAKVCIVLNEAASKASADPENTAAMASMWGAYQAAQNWSPPERPPSHTYNVVYSDGVTQRRELTEEEIDRWARESNELDATEPYQIVRIVDPQGRIVWGK